jgi:hypothetical protein
MGVSDPWRKKRAMGSLHPWPFVSAQRQARVQAPKEEKAKIARNHLHHANIKKESKFFVKRKIRFLPAGNEARPMGHYAIDIDITGFNTYNIPDFLTFARRQYYVRHESGI